MYKFSSIYGYLLVNNKHCLLNIFVEYYSTKTRLTFHLYKFCSIELSENGVI